MCFSKKTLIVEINVLTKKRAQVKELFVPQVICFVLSKLKLTLLH